MREDILKGLLRGEFYVAYQPQFVADGSRMVAVEALIRWSHPQLGNVGPATFLDLAQREDVITELGAFVFRQAMTDGLAWPEISVAINLSARGLAMPDLAQRVLATAQETGFPLARLEVEVSEKALIENFEAAAQNLARLRSLGVKIVLDDFGAGVASLGYLRKLPIDKLKIDKAFLDDAAQISTATIVQSVIAIARALNLTVTAVGVETEPQQLFLRLCGAHFIQGYLLARPEPAKEITARLVAATLKKAS